MIPLEYMLLLLIFNKKRVQTKYSKLQIQTGRNIVDLSYFPLQAREKVMHIQTIATKSVGCLLAVVWIGAAHAAPLSPSFSDNSGRFATVALAAPELITPEAELRSDLRRQVVDYRTQAAAGTVVIDTAKIGVGRDGFGWSGSETVTRKAEWPDWTPPQEMLARQPYLPRWMAGGEGNPMGARAMYLGSTVYRIHGTNMPETIGHKVSSGCIRMLNADVIDLYSRVSVGTKIVVLATPLISRR
jgi:lipoprotein-anchoring transpeptidase ErfK/SrfK